MDGLSSLANYKLIQKHNYKVRVAKDSKEALKFIAEHKPSLVISDIVMPGKIYRACLAMARKIWQHDHPAITETRCVVRLGT